MDTGSGMAILGSAIGGAKLLEKILGPTAEYLGEGLKDWTSNRIKNVSRIFTIANNKLGERIEEPGQVPPKILRKILTDGSFCDDELSAEYFGGVLASARSAVGRDDRAITFLNLTSNLSTYQLRAHYCFYALLKELFHGSKLRITHLEAITKMAILIPYIEYKKFMEFTPPEKGGQILVHITNGLFTSGLIGHHCFGGRDTVIKYLDNVYSIQTSIVPWASMVAEPAPLGFEFFLWAHGKGDIPMANFLNDMFLPHKVKGIPNIQAAVRITDFR